ncbi:hypothetical protein E2C01_096229 [Portunus trituberculatus]|uniref:Uncharacterized protein n=1 Tax=Portunus trituberculatus TaxID=210409 RepID=A0A5B7K7P4_PORTR|nr:hypothetical protein [Portunus trituberculatus]
MTQVTFHVLSTVSHESQGGP